MKRFAMFALLFLAPAMLVLAADDKPVGPDGTYKVTGLSKGGMKFPGDPATIFEGFSIKGDKLTMRMMGEDKVATIKVDAKAKPATIDITPDEGPEKGKTMLGIWKMEKGVLTLALVEGKDAKRPENFDAKGESDILMELTADEKKKEDKKEEKKEEKKDK